MMIPQPFARLARCALCLVLFLGACAPATTTQIAVDSEIRVVDELLYGHASQAAHIRSEEVKLLCMQARGFEYDQAPYEEAETDIADLVASLEFREQYGYGISIPSDAFVRSSDSEGGDAIVSYLDSLTAAELEEFESQLSRCQTEADEAVAMARSSYIESLPSDLQEQLDALANGTDETFVALEREWTTCMAAKGFNHGGTLQVLEFLYDEFERVSTTDAEEDDKELQRLEREMAIADFECSKDLKPALAERVAQLNSALSSAAPTSTMYEEQ